MGNIFSLIRDATTTPASPRVMLHQIQMLLKLFR